MAGRPCTICSHPKRKAIDAAVVANSDSIRAIARQYGVSPDPLRNHKENHIGALVVAAKAELDSAAEAETADTAKSVADHMRDLIAQLKDSHELVGAHLGNKDPKVALMAHAEQRQTITALSKIWLTIGQASGEIPTGAAQVNVLVVKEAERIRGDEWRYQDAMVAAAIDAMARRVPADEVSAARAEAAEAAWQARCRLGGGDVVDVDGEVVG